MRLFKLLGICMSLFIVIFLIACENNSHGEGGVDSENSTDSLTWGSSSLGSQGYVIIEAFASTVNNNVDFRNSSISTAGGAENLALLSQGEIDLGQATGDVLYNAYHGNDPFDQVIDFDQVLAYGYWSLPILVLADSDIKTVEDLRGRTLNVGTTGGSSAIIMEEVLNEYGLIDEINFEHLNNQEAAEALGTGQIDATVLAHLAGDFVASPYHELAQSREFRPIEYDEEILEKVIENNEGIIITETLKGTFDFYPEDTVAPGHSGVLITSPDMSEDAIYEITKSLLENDEDVRNIGPELKVFGKEYAVEGMVEDYPVHPGAVKYFEEIGIWEENLTIRND